MIFEVLILLMCGGLLFFTMCILAGCLAKEKVAAVFQPLLQMPTTPTELEMTKTKNYPESRNLTPSAPPQQAQMEDLQIGNYMTGSIYPDLPSAPPAMLKDEDLRIDSDEEGKSSHFTASAPSSLPERGGLEIVESTTDLEANISDTNLSSGKTVAVTLINENEEKSEVKELEGELFKAQEKIEELQKALMDSNDRLLAL